MNKQEEIHELNKKIEHLEHLCMQSNGKAYDMYHEEIMALMDKRNKLLENKLFD